MKKKAHSESEMVKAVMGFVGGQEPPLIGITASLDKHIKNHLEEKQIKNVP